MHRRFAAFLGALAVALVSVGTVSADTAGPTGANLELSWTTCHGTVCTDSSLYVAVLRKGGAQACLYLSNADAQGGGCTTDIGAVVYSGKYVVGIADTSINVENFGSVTTSASTALVGASFPWKGCSVPDSWNGSAYLVAGTLIVNGDEGAADGRTNVHVTHSVKRC